MNKYYHKIKELPFLLLIAVFVIGIANIIILYSAAGGQLEPWAVKQMTYYIIFIPIAVLIALIDIRILFRYSYAFYFIVLLLLLAVEIMGHKVMGAKRWLDIAGLRLQPSEPTKVVIVMMMAKYLHSLEYIEVNKFSKIFLLLIGVLVPVILIVKQPDLGTGIIVIIVSACLLYINGLKLWKFIAVAAALVLSTPIVWNLMHEYQQKRIMIFLDPTKDPLGSGYNIIQSKIAIGSGGIFGKGLGGGTQSHLDFLPEHQTDFIFAFLSEEFGFVGGIILLFLYALIILLSLSIAINCRHIYGRLIATGITSIFFSHVLINMAMVMGMLPVVGIPLPFMSYGGTMIASSLIGIGLIMNIKINQNIKL